jgi:hypothetical protein
VAAGAGGGQTPAQVPAAPPQITAPTAAAAPVRPVPPVPPAARDAGPGARPVITGPSFLGLSTPGPYVEPRADREAEPQIDRHLEGRDALRPSSNLDYLLEDDEEQPKRSSGKLILIVLALALAVGFGYLHWKQGGFDWLNQSDKKPEAAAKPPADSGQSGTGSAAGADTVNGAPAATATTPPASGTADSAGGTPASSASPSASPASAPPVTAAPDTAGQAAPQTSAAQAPSTQSAPSPAPATDPNLTPSSAPPAAGADSQTATPAVVPRAAARKSSPAKPTPAKPFDPVAEGERYIYGRGVRQDCDHGLRLVKRAAEQSNSKAMTSLGALYSTGTCTPRDLPTAYRWFALALHKDPDNPALQDDLQKLWAKMTQPERQLAIKLSQ